MNKRQLYESIMKNVAKLVKKALNENEYWDEPLKAEKEKFVFIVAYNKAYDWFVNSYADAMITSDYGDPNGFIIPESKWKNLARRFNNDIAVYDIDCDIDSIDEFEDNYKSAYISIEDLEGRKLN